MKTYYGLFLKVQALKQLMRIPSQICEGVIIIVKRA